MNTLVYHKDSKIIQELMLKDPKLKVLFDRRDEMVVRLSESYFESLVDTIIAQQLSSKVANVISKRAYEFFNNEINETKILNAREEDLKALGLSRQKIAYLKSLAECIHQGIVDLNHLELKTDQEIIDMLTKIKGIGVWTAQMFLMFSLGREDVFSVLDLGLRNALKKVYDDETLTHDQMKEIALKWSPYRSVVSHYLWHAWDTK